MPRHSTSLVALAALGTLVSPALGVNWVLSQAMSIAIARMDPIVNPGDVAGHAHNIIGGSRFSKDATTHDDQQASKCSSVNVQADKSNYWAPQVYYRYKDNTLAPMLGSARVYYFNTADDVVPFPPGLKMLSGLPGARNETDLKSFGLKISCNHGEQTSYLPTKETHPGGCSTLTMGIFFPSCGKADGSTDSEDHFSHMMWPHHYKGSTPWLHPAGAHCPDTHPIHYPAIFVEHNYWFSGDQPWRNEDNLLVLSNGDTTGLAYHADFQNGWDQNVLKQAIDTCTVGDQVSNCPAFKPTVNTEDAWNCRLEGEIPAEDVGLYAALPKLPGCNPLWTADMPNTKPKCDETVATPGYVAPNSYFRSDWQRMNIPLALPNATTDKLSNSLRPDIFQDMTPIVGPVGTSKIMVWGSEDSAKYVKVSSVTDILSNFVSDTGVKLGDSGSSGNTSSVPTVTGGLNAAPTGAEVLIQSAIPSNVHLADGDISASRSSAASSTKGSQGVPTVTVTHTAPAVTVTVADKTCRRNTKRFLARGPAAENDILKSHIARRSRRDALRG